MIALSLASLKYLMIGRQDRLYLDLRHAIRMSPERKLLYPVHAEVARLLTVFPPPGAADQPVNADDAFDIPVFVRHSSPLRAGRRPVPRLVGAASVPWPAIRDVPPSGAYLATTTWRDILDAATTVGRDPVPWLAKMPALAWSEIISRCSPLVAYLRRSSGAKALAGSSGYLLEPNAVYYNGTERTARAAFGYRVGMTMAEWVCRGLMGLGPTLHAEAYRPADAGLAWSPVSGLPDLVGDHWRPPITWLVEAKGARRTGQTFLAKGARQLSGRGLMSGPHVRVLCGASLEPRLFVTVDVEILPSRAPLTAPPEIPDPASDDSVLLNLARSRMLAYYSLRALADSALSVRPVGLAVADPESWRRRVGLVYPLEQDPSTQQERSLAQNPSAYAEQRPPAQRLDMLTGRVPGTNMIMGLSRRLFEACRNLADDEQQIAEETESESEYGLFDLEEEIEEFTQERRAGFAEREATLRGQLREDTRQGFERGRNSSWYQLIEQQPAINSGPAPGLLESATADTYLAIDRLSVLP
jgi:hypothetical protein